MKKVFLYIMFAAVGLGLQSCLHDNDEVFGQSAAERINAAISNAHEVLESAENGWAFHYFVGEEYAFGATNLVAVFKDGKVTMYGQDEYDNNGEHYAITSTYKLTRDQGPVLAFDTYNDLLHKWGDPAGANAPTDVDGWEADYEFVIMNISEDKNTIKLKGKKFNNIMTLERLSVAPSEYLTTVEEVADVLSGNVMTYVSGANDTVKAVTTDYEVSFTYKDANGESKTVSTPFYFTPAGINFVNPVQVLDMTVPGLIYKENSAEVPFANDPTKALLISTDIFDQFMNGNWYIDADNLSDYAKAGFMSFVNACATKENELVNYCYLGTYTYQAGTYFGLHFNSSGWLGAAAFDVAIADEEQQLVTLTPTEYVLNGEYYAKNDNFGDAIKIFSATFKLEKDRVVSPKAFTLTDVNNPNNVIKLVKDYVANPGHVQ